MDANRFKELLEELDGNSIKTLTEKNAKYSLNHNGDALHNFRAGGEVIGGTPADACWGYLTKHLVALRDMVERNDFSDREDFLEKCQDSINYIRFLWCIGNDIENIKRFDIEMSNVCGCPLAKDNHWFLSDCEKKCNRYSNCDSAALANDILASLE